MKVNKKAILKILSYVVLALLAVLLVVSIIYAPIQAKKENSNTPAPPVKPDDPDDPGKDKPEHDYKWHWVYSEKTNQHWQQAECECHKGEVKPDSAGSHVYEVDGKYCKICNYPRVVPTNQNKLDFEIDGDGNAVIGGIKSDGEPVKDLVIPGTFTVDGKEVNVVKIKEKAFDQNNDLTSVRILDGVKFIGPSAFASCSELKEVRLPKSVENIDSSAFQFCRKLESIIIEDGNPTYYTYRNCIIETKTKTLVIGCKGSEIPNTSQYFVTSIGDNAFYGSGIIKIDIPATVTQISINAFRECIYLTEFTFPETVTRIGEYTFNGCSALETVTFHDGITQIGQNAFANCTSLDNVILPSGIITVETNTFQNCTSLKNITLSEGLLSLNSLAFSGCTALTSITLPSTIQGIDTGAFTGCSALTEIIFAGTQEEWNANVKTASGWKPDNAELKFTTASAGGESETQKDEQDSPDGENNQ